MKPTLAAFGLTLALCTMAFAQESGDRIVVPPASGNRPRVVNCNLLNGTINVRTHASGDVIVEGEGHTHEENQGGMHRIPRGNDAKGTREHQARQEVEEKRCRNRSHIRRPPLPPRSR